MAGLRLPPESCSLLLWVAIVIEGTGCFSHPLSSRTDYSLLWGSVLCIWGVQPLRALSLSSSQLWQVRCLQICQRSGGKWPLIQIQNCCFSGFQAAWQTGISWQIWTKHWCSGPTLRDVDWISLALSTLLSALQLILTNCRFKPGSWVSMQHCARGLGFWEALKLPGFLHRRTFASSPSLLNPWSRRADLARTTASLDLSVPGPGALRMPFFRG